MAHCHYHWHARSIFLGDFHWHKIRITLDFFNILLTSETIWVRNGYVIRLHIVIFWAHCIYAECIFLKLAQLLIFQFEMIVCSCFGFLSHWINHSKLFWHFEKGKKVSCLSCQWTGIFSTRFKHYNLDSIKQQFRLIFTCRIIYLVKH